MGKCSLKAKRIATLFARRINAGQDINTSLDYLYGGVMGEHAASVAQVAYAAIVLPDNLHLDIARNSDDTEAIRKFILDNRAVADFSKFENSGLGTFEEFVSSIDNNINPTEAEVGPVIDVTSSEADITTEIGGQVAIDVKNRSTVLVDSFGNEFAKKKLARIKANEGLKKGSSDVIENFLKINFPNSYGAEFMEWARDKFYDSMIKHGEEDAGFVTNISDNVNQIKNNLKKEQESYRSIKGYEDGDILEQLRNNTIRTKYFIDTLLNEFDFVLENVIPIISVSPKLTRELNGVIEGMTDTVGEEIPRVRINPAEISDLLTEDDRRRGVYTLREDINKELQILPLDSYTFLKSTSLEPSSIYQLNDGSTWFLDAERNAFEITEKSVYTYAYDSNRNFDSIDHYINPIDQGTKFINSIFPMMRYIKENDGVYSYGDRMTITDYLSIAPYLLDSGRTIQDLTSKIKKIASEKGRNYKIARSLAVHIFNDVPTVVDGQEVYSINTAKSDSLENINEDIVKALYSALVSKELTRRIMVENNNVIITKKLGEGNEGNMVNGELSGYLTNHRGRTKANIANHIKVIEGDVMILSRSGDVEGPLLSLMTSVDSLGAAMDSLGLSGLYNKIMDSWNKNNPGSDNDMGAVRILRKIIEVSAANINTKGRKKQEALDVSDIKHNYSHEGFYKLAPSVIISGADLDNLAEVFHPETNRNITVAGEKVNPSSTPNRDAFISKQLDLFGLFNEKVSHVKADFMPFFGLPEDSKIPKAKYIGNLIKTSILKDGTAIGVADWTMKVRLEYAMITGFIDGPKDSIGRKFYIQPVNYSDKSAIEMLEVDTEDTILDSNKATGDRLKEAYIEYQIKRYEYQQKVSIQALKEFVGGNFETLSKAIAPEKIADFIKLRDMLVNKTYPQEGDMTRPINKLLAKINLDADLIAFSNSNLDKNADYVTFKGSGNSLFLKPHMGIRAAEFRANGKKITEEYLKGHREQLKEYKVDDTRVGNALKKYKKTKTLNINEFYDRFFLINTLLGHSLKTATMGDESYFGSKGYKANTIDAYYSSIDSGKATGLEEVSAMLKNQFKRAQSELSRGVLYAQQETLVGLKRRHRNNNMLTHLDIYSRFDENENEEKQFKFEELEGKTPFELEAMDILVPFESGLLMAGNETTQERFVRLRVGDHILTVSSTTHDDSPILNPLFGVDRGLLEGLNDFVDQIPFHDSTIPMQIQADGNESIEDNTVLGNLNLTDFENVRKLSSTLVMPDFIPSITATDPSSYINLLNSMDISQENSDAIQFMHPLMAMITDQARGGKFGAFHTDNNEALKTVTLTFEYDRFRQVLQKKSVQNPFTYEQFKKVGSIEMFNAFKSMNTAIPFKQQNMKVPKIYKGEVVGEEYINFSNLDELFVHFGGYKDSGDRAWEQVLSVLKNNPANLYSFVGYLTVPSNQKTGHKKMNKWDNVFSKEKGNKPVLDYTGNEYNFEILTKSHGYDVSGNADHASTIALLSQLVNAVGFGGNSKQNAKSLQDAMSGVMELNRFISGHALSERANAHRLTLPTSERAGYGNVIYRLSKGNPSTNGYTDAELKVYREVMRAGVEDMAKLAFNEGLDSALIKDIILDKNKSLDTPSVMAKVIGTLRSALFKDTVKMKMSGYIGTVSAVHKTINVYSLPNGVRAGRYGFIKGALTHGLEGVPGEVIELGENNLYVQSVSVPVNEEMKSLEDVMLPYDLISVDGIIMEAHSIDIYDAVASGRTVKVVITPDILDSPVIDSIDKLYDLDDHTPIMINGESMLQWYYRETNDAKQIASDILNGRIVEDTNEKYSLRWYDLNSNEGNLKDTKAYKDFYRAFKEGASKDEIKRLTTLLIVETQRRDADGDNVYKLTLPEVVLPTFMRSAFDIPANTSLSDIIGTDGNELMHAKAYFEKHRPRRLFKKEDTRWEHSKSSLLSKYSMKVALGGQKHDIAILEFINKQEVEIFDKPLIRQLNTIVEAARQDHASIRAKDFLKALKVVLTRIPGQSKQSGFAAKVIELLDSQGNSTHAGTDHLVNTGGDMDIDTLSVLTKTIDRSGRIFDVSKYTGPKGFEVDKLLKDFKADVKANTETVVKAVKAHNNYIDKQIELVKAQEEKDPIAVEKLEAKKIDVEKRTRIIKDRENRLVNKYHNILSNAIEQGVYKSLVDVNTMVEVNTPITMSMFKDILATLPEPDEADVHGESYMPIFIFEEANAQGKMSIGVFATVLKINSAVQVAKMYFDDKYAEILKKEGINSPFIFNTDLGYFDVTEGKDVKYLQTSFSDLDRFFIADVIAKDPAYQRAIVQILESEEGADPAPLAKLLQSEVDKFLEEYPSTDKDVLEKVLISKAKSLFDLDISGVLDPKGKLKRLFKKPENVSKAYSEILGKQLSNDAQSQFLSAATDNAKELILGKIRSSALTNSIITSMMLLNYDVPAIIKFLYDPQISIVLDHYNTLQGGLEKVRLNIDDLDGKIIKHISKNSPAIKSLKKILAISEEIDKFRAVRSLNESFKVEQHALDSILEDLDSDNLYKAIIADDITRIKATTPAQSVFNPNMFVFLHPQSRSLFKNLYEIEMNKIPALFNSAPTLRRFLTRNRNNNAYKNTVQFLSGALVENYLTTPKDGKIITGSIAVKKGLNYTPTNVKLNSVEGRERFINGFEDYFEYASREIIRLTKRTNPAFGYVGFSTPYGATNSILNIPLLKHANTEVVDVAVIKHGIEELRTATGNEALDKVQQDLYRSLSLYSLITSAGQVKKGSIIELFKEINYDFSEHINTLTPQDFMNLMPKTPQGKVMVVENLPTKQSLIKSARTKTTDEENPIVVEGQVDESQETVGEGFDESREDTFIEQPIFTSEKIDLTPYVKIEPTIPATKQKVYTGNLKDSVARPMVYYGSNKDGRSAYRLFKKRKEILPYSTVDSEIKFKDLSSQDVKDITHLGYQVGLDAMYGGEKIRIIGFERVTKIEEAFPVHHKYIITGPKGERIVAGPHLMKQNDDLFLYGNLIENVSSFNRRAYEQVYKKIISKADMIPDEVVFAGEKKFRNETISRIFTPNQLADPLLDRETQILNRNTAGGAREILKVSKLGNLKNVTSYAGYHSNLKAAEPGHREVLIPAYPAVTEFDNVSGRYVDIREDETKELTGKVAMLFNDLLQGNDPLSLYGLQENKLAGGINIVEKVLENVKGFKAKKVLSSDIKNMYKYIITRTNKNYVAVPVNGEVHFVKTMTADRNTKAKAIDKKSVAPDMYTQVVPQAISMDLIEVTHKKIKLPLGEDTYESMVFIESAQSDPAIFVKVNDRILGDKIYQVVKKSAKQAENFDYQYKFSESNPLKLYVSSKLFNQFKGIISEDTSELFHKPSC